MNSIFTFLEGRTFRIGAAFVAGMITPWAFLLFFVLAGSALFQTLAQDQGEIVRYWLRRLYRYLPKGAAVPTSPLSVGV